MSTIGVEGTQAAMSPSHVTVLLCDGAVQATGKWSLVGVFTHVQAKSFPARVGVFWMFVSIRDFRIDRVATVRLEIVDNRADSDGNMRASPLWSAEVKISPPEMVPSGGKLIPLNFAIPVVKPDGSGKATAIEFPASGDYDVNVLIDNVFVGFSSIRAVQLPGA